MVIAAVGFVGLSVLAGIAVPVILKQQKYAALASCVSNAKQIDLMLTYFEADYNSFPNDQTAAAVREKTNTDLPLGNTTSNDYFRQLIAAQVIDSELTFYAHVPGIHKPDNVTAGSHCLEAGECAFTYVFGLTSGDDGSTPLVLTPMIPGTTTFDPQPFSRKAVVVHVDHTTTVEPIDSTGHVMVNGMDLFDPKQPFWHGKNPQLRYPKL